MSQPIPISGTTRVIGSDAVFFIAEVGKGFIQTEDDRPVSEYLDNAKKLARAAYESGAAAVKFQTHILEDEQLPIDITSPHFKGADRYNWVKRNMLATPLEEFWKPLKVYCDDLGILFFSTPMSRDAAILIEDLGVVLWKVGSGDVQDYVLLDYLATTGKPIIISSGMVSLYELDEVIQYLCGKDVSLCVLYCISKYPAPKDYFNLSTIQYLQEKYPNVPIGFSDHSLGDEVSRAAVQLGACVIEKHFSFSRDLWGSDHKVAMTPEEFKTMVQKVRAGESVDAAPYLGEMERELEGATNEFRQYFNKTLVAGKQIRVGDVFDSESIYAMRPRIAGEIPANRLHTVIGRQSNRNIAKYDPIRENDFS